MNNVILTEEQYAKALQIAAEVGAQTALNRFEEEKQREAKELMDSRLRNTKLLLRNYRLFKAHVENAVYDPETDLNPLEIIRDLMKPGRNGSLVVESIKKSAARTAIIVDHIEKMLRIYHAYCLASNGVDDLRRWRVVEGLYISVDKRTVAELARAEGVVERTIYKDVDAACDTIAPLMFGIDGIRKR